MILLVNDDGIDAEGLRQLYRALRGRTRHPILAVAPREAMSARSHAVTIDRGLSVHPVKEEGFFGFAIDGTPCDCVKLALTAICRTPPRLVVSGINDGPNVGRSLFYSGTVAAGLEGAIEGYPALAVSKDRDGGDFTEAAEFAAEIVSAMLRRNDADGLCLNLNCPARPLVAWEPLILCPHGLSGFDERFRPRRDQQGRVRWHLQGSWFQRDDENDCDAAALRAGHPTLSILSPDFNPPTASGSDKLLRRLQRAERQLIGRRQKVSA